MFLKPAVSIGNVGQLAIDVLVYNLSLEKIGYLYDSSILPLVGNDAFTKPGEGAGNLVTSGEGNNCRSSIRKYVYTNPFSQVVLTNIMIYNYIILITVYMCDQKKLVVVQQRAPIAKVVLSQH